MMGNTVSKWSFGGAFVLIFLAGYFVGVQRNISQVESSSEKDLETLEEDVERANAFSMITFLKRSGDLIEVSLSGNGRLVVDDHTFFEDEGNHSFSFGALPTDEDLVLRDFPYLGNAKTRKFYNTDSYPARGTEIKYRRFFETKEAAVEAGFIAAKNLR